MKRFLATTLVIAPFALALSACNQNTAEGNDREARVEPAPTPAPIANARVALQNTATEIIKPEPMSNVDVEALGGRQGRCAVVLTEVAFPSFLYLPKGSGAIKLNGKLIPLPRTGEWQFGDGGLSVTLRPRDEKGAAGLPAMEMLLVLPGAEDEIGYKGYVRCFDGGKA